MVNDYKVGEYILYRNGDRFEVGKIKSLREDGAFIYYHRGEAAALTRYEDMHKIANSMFITCLGGEANA